MDIKNAQLRVWRGDDPRVSGVAASRKAKTEIAMREIRETVRWYERGRWPYATDRKTVEQYAHWLKQVDWRLFCTFTFAWRVNDEQANKTFAEFINRLERHLGCDVGFVRGDEKRSSGCGKPACGRHFHVLLACAAPVSTSYVEYLWTSMAGNRSDDAGAKVKAYDSPQNGVAYVMKAINQEHGDWTFRKMHLFHPEARSLQTVNARKRRNIRRHRERQRQFCNSIAIGSEG
jgi:hypothetical protein